MSTMNNPNAVTTASKAGGRTMIVRADREAMSIKWDAITGRAARADLLRIAATMEEMSEGREWSINRGAVVRVGTDYAHDDQAPDERHARHASIWIDVRVTDPRATSADFARERAAARAVLEAAALGRASPEG